MSEEGRKAQEAHRAEILEGLVESLLTGDFESFKSMRTEWERFDQPGEADGRYALRFHPGEPEHYLETGFCYHCREPWQRGGVRFGPAIPGMSQMIHMEIECTNPGDCSCWVGPEDGVDLDHPFGWPNCQRCGRAGPICECDGGVAYGPCALVWRAGVTPPK